MKHTGKTTQFVLHSNVKTIESFLAKQINQVAALFYQEAVFHNLFPPSNYRAVFHNKQLREQFNKGLTAVRSSGKGMDIYQFYSELFKQY